MKNFAATFFSICVAISGPALAEERAQPTPILFSVDASGNLDREAWFASITASAEARGEPNSISAQTRIVEVIRNRVRAHFMGDTRVEDVVRHRWQFSAWNDNGPMREDLERLARGEHARARDLEASALAILPVARALLSGERQSLLPANVLNYAALADCDPAWARGRKPIYVEGAHSFFAAEGMPN